MSLPPALLQRLAQRGLVQKQNDKDTDRNVAVVENEEVIAEDYDEMETDHAQEDPSQYEHLSDTTKKRTEENFWLERMKARMGEAGSATGYKGCPNKYNIYHKCNLYCVNRWVDGRPEPTRDYMRRYKRLLRKYPLPKGWVEMYDPGCGCYYFWGKTDNMVSWLPPTHPKSQVSKSAAAYRRQMEEASGDVAGSDGEERSDDDEDEEESSEMRHQREIDDIISSTLRPRSPTATTPQELTNLQETVEAENIIAPPPVRKQKTRDLDRTLSRQRRGRERASGSSQRHHGRDEPDILDPMDPSAYSDTPRGKWSDGLNTGAEERKKSSGATEDAAGKERAAGARERYNDRSDDEEDD